MSLNALFFPYGLTEYCMYLSREETYHKCMTTHTYLNAHFYTQLLSTLAEIARVCCQGLQEGQSVSVICVYVFSQSWEWHETHKASPCQSCGLQQCVSLHCHRNKAHIYGKIYLGFMRYIFFIYSKKPKKMHVESSDSFRYDLLEMCTRVSSLLCSYFIQK